MLSPPLFRISLKLSKVMARYSIVMPGQIETGCVLLRGLQYWTSINRHRVPVLSCYSPSTGEKTGVQTAIQCVCFHESGITDVAAVVKGKFEGFLAIASYV